MSVWTFFDFLEADGGNAIRAWLQDLPQEAQAKIDARLLQMAGMAPPWPEKWISSIKGYEDLIELRIPCNRVQYRPLGFYGPDRLEFTLLIGAIEKGTIRKSVLETAAARMKLVKDNRGHICEHQFD